jgi:hypothetical protein
MPDTRRPDWGGTADLERQRRHEEVLSRLARLETLAEALVNRLEGFGVRLQATATEGEMDEHSRRLRGVEDTLIRLEPIPRRLEGVETQMRALNDQRAKVLGGWAVAVGIGAAVTAWWDRIVAVFRH